MASRQRPSSLTRRDLIRNAALGAGALAVSNGLLTGCDGGRTVRSDEKLRVAMVGSGGKGMANLDGILGTGETVVAFCDVDAHKIDGALAALLKKTPSAAQPRRYRDYRELLAGEPDLHAVMISTPDHMHAPVAVAAMARGLHVYCEKPLTRTIAEARRLSGLARSKGLVTQMGNQGSASSDMRHGIEIVRAGVIGPVRAVHAWTNRPVWPQGIARPEGADPVPDFLNWDGWLGVAPERPYKEKVYHTFNWRGWYDFGCGAFGDMGCHTLNLPFRALQLADPYEIEGVATSDHMPETFPHASTVRFAFKERGGLPATTLWWYDGGTKPPADVIPEAVKALGPLGGSGLLLVGDAGWIFSTDDYNTKLFIALKGENTLTAASAHAAALAVPASLPRAAKGHYQEWVDAIRGGAPTFSSFAIGSKLTETCLLGTIAQRCPGRKLAWDAAAMSFGDVDADALVKPKYRAAWAV